MQSFTAQRLCMPADLFGPDKFLDSRHPSEGQHAHSQHSGMPAQYQPRWHHVHLSSHSKCETSTHGSWFVNPGVHPQRTFRACKLGSSSAECWQAAHARL